jgi:AhpD family alkylhydroperoxidase
VARREVSTVAFSDRFKGVKPKTAAKAPDADATSPEEMPAAEEPPLEMPESEAPAEALEPEAEQEPVAEAEEPEAVPHEEQPEPAVSEEPEPEPEPEREPAVSEEPEPEPEPEAEPSPAAEAAPGEVPPAEPKPLRRGLPTSDEVRQVNDYMMEKMGYVPHMFQVMNTIVTEPGKTFADFYNSLAQDGALPRKYKELIFVAIGVSYCSPHSILHVMPALRAGATMPEIFEAACVGTMAAGWVPNGPGMPAAFEYAQKCMEVADHVLKGEPWDFMPEPKFDRGIY